MDARGHAAGPQRPRPQWQRPLVIPGDPDDRGADAPLGPARGPLHVGPDTVACSAHTKKAVEEAARQSLDRLLGLDIYNFVDPTVAAKLPPDKSLTPPVSPPLPVDALHVMTLAQGRGRERRRDTWTFCGVVLGVEPLDSVRPGAKQEAWQTMLIEDGDGAVISLALHGSIFDLSEFSASRRQGALVLVIGARVCDTVPAGTATGTWLPAVPAARRPGGAREPVVTVAVHACRHFSHGSLAVFWPPVRAEAFDDDADSVGTYALDDPQAVANENGYPFPPGAGRCCFARGRHQVQSSIDGFTRLRSPCAWAEDNTALLDELYRVAVRARDARQVPLLSPSLFAYFFPSLQVPDPWSVRAPYLGKHFVRNSQGWVKECYRPFPPEARTPLPPVEPAAHRSRAETDVFERYLCDAEAASMAQRSRMPSSPPRRTLAVAAAASMPIAPALPLGAAGALSSSSSIESLPPSPPPYPKRRDLGSHGTAAGMKHAYAARAPENNANAASAGACSRIAASVGELEPERNGAAKNEPSPTKHGHLKKKRKKKYFFV